MNKRFAGLVIIVAFLMLVPLQSYGATPKETVETGVNQVLKTLGDPAFKAQSKEQQIAENRYQDETPAGTAAPDIRGCLICIKENR